MVNLEDYIEVDVCDRVKEQAQEAARRIGQLEDSILKGEGNLASCIGKIVVAEYLETECHLESQSYTLMYGGRRSAVKTTQSQGCPDTSFEAKVPMKNAKNQGCEIYIFTRVSYDYKKAWILGWYPKERFLEDAEKVLAGDFDASNRWTAKADCYSIDISELAPLEKYLIDL